MKPRASLQRVLLACLICGVMAYGCLSVLANRAPGVMERRVALYQDSMHPWVKSYKPGKCTICGMALTPIYEGQQGFGLSDGMVVLSSNSTTVLNVQTDEVKRQPLLRTLRVAGILEANETRKSVISAPVAARIQNLTVPYVGVEVQEGQPLVALFSPELAQKRSYLRAVGVNLLPLGSDLTQVAKAQDPFASQLVAPQSGIVIERNVYNGQYVVEGEKLLVIADAAVLWFRFDVYEGQLPWFEPGQAIDVTVAAVPERKFPATISFFDPTINDTTRAVKARADIANPFLSTNIPVRRMLRFGMYAEGRVHAAIPNVLAVPRSAIIFPGSAAYAYVDKGDGAYERRCVKLGRQGDSCWEVLHGLKEGERVVTSGNALIDAQAQFNQGSDSVAGVQVAVVPDETATIAETQAILSAGLSASVDHNPPAVPVVAGKTEAENMAPGIKAKPLTHYQADKIRMAVRDEMWKMRMATIAKACGMVPAQSDTNLLFPVTP
ncbi:MAG: efflux RND transporter periplasmic adaptor subunit [bacterium]